MENVIIKERLQKLRQVMQEEKIDFFLIPTADYHNSEYVDGYFKTREFFSGFTGSAGTLVVSQNAAGLWTDGRYFIQADKELCGTGITLYRMMDEGVPTVMEYLVKEMTKGQVLAFDGKVMTAFSGNRFAEKLEAKGIKLRYDYDPASEVWAGRPHMACNPIMVLDQKLCGLSLAEKVEQVREVMKKKGCKYHLLSKLDDIMWLFNIRGKDVACNPVAFSYAFIEENEIRLFMDEGEMTEESRCYLAEQAVHAHGYEDIEIFLENYPYEGKVLLDRKAINYSLYKILNDKNVCVFDTNPTELLKAIKNETELEHIRETYIKDSAVVTKFIFKMKDTVGKTPMNEYLAATELNGMRSETEGFLDLSFETISAYGENAAMMHYEATENDNKELAPEGMLLVDSGGQYLGGTTDVTRTFALGPVTEEMKEHFTLVAMGMLRLANAKFLEGCSGRNLDILARQPLWEKGIDYKCGTGHGIGYILNVHEGPHSIRWRFSDDVKEVILKPGMIVSDEPGVYLEGRYGIRTENILEVVAAEKNSDGQFLKFDMLTYVPIDLELIDTKWMQKKDIDLLNAYHKDVYDKLAPFMNEDELIWLKEATRQISL